MYGILFDVNLCVGCEACLDACQAENHLPDSKRERLSAANYTVLQDEGDDRYLRQMCRHCIDPACASACPVGALHKTEAGPVVYDYEKCIGCRYCMVACPFSIPRYEWDTVTPRVRKCQMCPERVLGGKQTACAEACPTGATTFGERVDLIAEAWKRISKDPDNYAPAVYGLQDAGGTCVMVIGPKDVMASLEDGRIPQESLPHKTWIVLSQIPTAVGVAAVGMLGVNWVIRRRMALANGTMEDVDGESHGEGLQLGDGHGDDGDKGERS